MKRVVTLLAIALAAGLAKASWYWPFGSDDGGSDRPRLSELMEPVTSLIDEASDLAQESKIQEAVEKYRAALAKLDQIEMENADRVEKPEFATVRNKRAYVNAAIDSLQLHQAASNARAVAVSDTTKLEARYRSEKLLSRKERAMEDLSKKDYAAALLEIGEMLTLKPNDPGALNLRAAVEIAQENYRAAEATLDQAIRSNPRSHYAYYNMASLILRVNPARKAAARRYYEAGRDVGGPQDGELDKEFQEAEQ